MHVLPALAYAEEAEELMLFTDRQHPFSNADGHTVIHLDRVQDIEDALTAQVERLNLNLSEHSDEKTLDQARQQLAGILSGTGDISQQALMDAYAGISLAWSLGITHVPAVVSGDYVVYGVQDVDTARALIRSHQAEQQAEQVEGD